MIQDIFTQQWLYKILCRLGIDKAPNIIVAYSGGVDSHVLLHALVGLRRHYPTIKLAAVHVHHGLNVNADNWVKHCRNVCLQLDVPYIVRYVDANTKLSGCSLEEVARELRYNVLAEELMFGANLVVAHHADDQVETLLLQLFRGSGPKGLAAMPETKGFAAGKILRPLLGFSRKALLDYAILHNLQWIEDDSNLNVKFARNYVRHELLPSLKKRWPGILQTLSRVTNHCASADELLTVLAQQDYALIACETPAGTLSITLLKQLSVSRQCNVIRYWLTKFNFVLPSQVKIQQIITTVLNCRIDADPVVNWRGGEVRRHHDYLYAMLPMHLHDNNWSTNWDLQFPLELPSGLGRLEASFLSDCANIDFTKISVRFRCGGEVCRLRERGSSHSLKKLFQEWNVPPWLRDRVPLLYYNEQIIAVIGYCIVEGWQDKIMVIHTC